MAKKRRSSQSRPRGKGKWPRFSLKGIFFNKVVLWGLVVIVLAGGTGYGGWYFFMHSPLFSVKEIVVNKDEGYDFDAGLKKMKNTYIGRNIFTIDMAQVKMLIQESFPHLRKVEVRRKMPDRLEVDITPRQAIAFIKKGRNLVFDKEGYVLGEGGRTAGLIEIRGVSFFFTPSRGDRVDDARLGSALALIDALRRSMPAFWRYCEYVDVSNKSNIVLGIEGVTVKMGSEDFARKISKLEEILRDPQINMKDLSYIDLRFDEAVISPR